MECVAVGRPPCAWMVLKMPAKKTPQSMAARSVVPFHQMAPVGVLIAGLSGCTSGDLPVAATEVFDSSVLHHVDITVDAEYLPQLATDLENRVPSTIVYDGEKIAYVGIRQKGNKIIPLEEKPSFSIRFDEFDNTADLHGLHKLLLNGTTVQDPTFLHEKLGAEAHARVGLPAARVAHAKLTLNGVDKGIYVVVESIDKDFLQLHFGKDYDNGNLYEGPCCGDFATNEPYRLNDMTLDDEKKDNRTRDDINALASVITKTPDAILAAELAKKLDVDQYIKIFALEALIWHWDGYAFGLNNYYLYDHPLDARFVFLPHGMDQILSNMKFDSSIQSIQGRLAGRIRQVPELNARFLELEAEVNKTAWNKAVLLATIDSTATMLHNAGSGAQTAADLKELDNALPHLRNVIDLIDAKVNP